MTWVKLIVLAAVGLANVEAAPTREGVLTHEGAVAATARKQLFSSTPTPPDSDTGDPDRCPLPTNTVEETVAAILDAVSRLDIPCIVYYALHGSTSPDGFTACMLTAVRAYIESRDPIQGLRQLLRDLRSCIAGAPELPVTLPAPPGLQDTCPAPHSSLLETITAIIDAATPPDLNVICVIYYAIDGFTPGEGAVGCIIRAVENLFETKNVRHFLSDIRGCLGRPDPDLDLDLPVFERQECPGEMSPVIPTGIKTLVDAAVPPEKGLISCIFDLKDASLFPEVHPEIDFCILNVLFGDGGVIDRVTGIIGCIFDRGDSPSPSPPPSTCDVPPGKEKVDKCSDVGRSADECADYYVEIKKCDDPDLPYEETCSGFPRECESCAGGSSHVAEFYICQGTPGAASRRSCEKSYQGTTCPSP